MTSRLARTFWATSAQTTPEVLSVPMNSNNPNTTTVMTAAATANFVIGLFMSILLLLNRCETGVSVVDRS